MPDPIMIPTGAPDPIIIPTGTSDPIIIPTLQFTDDTFLVEYSSPFNRVYYKPQHISISCEWWVRGTIGLVVWCQFSYRAKSIILPSNRNLATRLLSHW